MKLVCKNNFNNLSEFNIYEGGDMGTWSSSNPCKNCGRKNGTMMKCEKCGTLGCPHGQCVRGTVTCGVCKKPSKKIKI